MQLMTFRMFLYIVTSYKVYIFKENLVDLDGLEGAISRVIWKDEVRQE